MSHERRSRFRFQGRPLSKQEGYESYDSQQHSLPRERSTDETPASEKRPLVALFKARLPVISMTTFLSELLHRGLIHPRYGTSIPQQYLDFMEVSSLEKLAIRAPLLDRQTVIEFCFNSSNQAGEIRVGCLSYQATQHHGFLELQQLMQFYGFKSITGEWQPLDSFSATTPEQQKLLTTTKVLSKEEFKDFLKQLVKRDLTYPGFMPYIASYMAIPEFKRGETTITVNLKASEGVEARASLKVVKATRNPKRPYKVYIILEDVPKDSKLYHPWSSLFKDFNFIEL